MRKGFTLVRTRLHRNLANAQGFTLVRTRLHRNLANAQGFTLVEVLVAVSLLSLMIGLLTSLFLVAISVQNQSLTIQGLVNNSSPMAEYMTRALRQARKDTGQGCLSSPGLNYEITHFGLGIKFVNRDNQCHEFFQEGERIKETRGTQTLFLSPDDVKVLAFRVALQGESQTDTKQPLVSFFFDMQGAGLKPSSQTRFQLHTSVSQRAYDI